MLTSYYAKIRPTQPGAICISRSQPRWARGQYPSYKALAPGKWYRTAEIEEYIPLYQEILDALDPQRVYDDLMAIAQTHARSLGKDPDAVEPILLCFESPADFCHRRMTANWLETSLGIEVPEGYYDDQGQRVIVPGWEEGAEALSIGFGQVSKLEQGTLI